MFGKSKKPAGATVIGAGDSIEGSLIIEGMLHVDGQIQGDVRAAGQVSIGPDGLIVGEVEADVVTIAGRVEGRLVAQSHLHVLSTGVFEGDAFFGSLQVDRGGVVHGSTADLDTAKDDVATEGADDESGEDEDLGEAEPQTLESVA